MKSKAIEPCIYPVNATKRYPAGFRVRKVVQDQWGDRRQITEIVRPIDNTPEARQDALDDARTLVKQWEREKRTGRLYRRFDGPKAGGASSSDNPRRTYTMPWHEMSDAVIEEFHEESQKEEDERKEATRKSLTLKDFVEMGLDENLKIDHDADDVVIGYLRKARGKSQGQWYKASGAWKAVCEWGRIHELNVDQITGDHVDAFVRWAEGQRKDNGDHRWSASTIRGYRMVLRSMIKGFARHLRVPNPLDLVPTEINPATIDAPEATRKTPTRAEAAAVEKTLIKRVSESPEDTDRRLTLILWRFMSQTGLRPGEALALTIEKIDFEQGVVTVDQALDRERNVGMTKTGKRYPQLNARPVVIVDQTVELLRSWLDQREAHGFPSKAQADLVFPDADGGHWKDGDLQSQFKEAREETKDLGEDLQLTPYSARHYRVAEVRRAGIPEAVATRQLGHQKDSHLKYGLPDVEEMREWMRNGLND
jgi:integrase